MVAVSTYMGGTHGLACCWCPLKKYLCVFLSHVFSLKDTWCYKENIIICVKDIKGDLAFAQFI